MPKETESCQSNYDLRPEFYDTGFNNFLDQLDELSP